MIIVDANNRIKRANRAAADLFDVADPKLLTGKLDALFGSVEKAKEAIGLPDGYLGEYDVRRISSGVSTPTDVSRRSLPEDTGGAIYVFRKTTHPART